MARITALRLGKGRNKKANVSLDGKLAFNLEPEVALKEGLKVGQELSASRIEALIKTSHQQSCYDAALRYLGYRPRSEYEIRQRLYQRGSPSQRGSTRPRWPRVVGSRGPCASP